MILNQAIEEVYIWIIGLANSIRGGSIDDCQSHSFKEAISLPFPVHDVAMHGHGRQMVTLRASADNGFVSKSRYKVLAA